MDLLKERSERDLLTMSKNTAPIPEKENSRTPSSHMIRNALGSKKNKNTNEAEEIEMRHFHSSVEDTSKVLGVFIHHTECLKMDFLILHPVVKVLVVDSSTGRLIKKSDARRKVTSYYEGEHVQSIAPCMTQPFEFRKKHSPVPRWEEVILFNESFSYLKSYGSNLILFFLLQDFVSMNSANNKPGGWHHIAWAFLKLFPSPDRANVGSKLRLQLYKRPRKDYGSSSNSFDGIQTVWKWWNAVPRAPYASSLYVTVQAIDPPAKEKDSVLRSLAPNQGEAGLGRLETNIEVNAWEREQHSWSRLPGQSCKIPKTVKREINEGSSSVLCMDVSGDGHWLAVASYGSGAYVIHVYEALTFEQAAWSVRGNHRSYIYQLHWDCSSSHLLSCSGDGSARIWKDSKEMHVLEHPAYIYCGRFHPSSPMVATGGFDHVVRIWDEISGVYVVVRELLGHSDFITALEFDLEGQSLFSGDNGGFVRVWGCVESRWNKKRDFTLPEIRGCPINDIKVHPGGRRLLVHSRSITNALLMIDLRLGSVMQKYTGSQSFMGSSRTRCCITPCGSFIFAGSQDGAAFVWNTDTGEKVHVYTSPFQCGVKATPPPTVSAVAYHPRNHVFILASPTPGAPLLVFEDDSQSGPMSPCVKNDEKVEQPANDFETILEKLDIYLQENK